jgi:hypothetical protein
VPNLIPSIDRYILRLTVVPMIGTYRIRSHKAFMVVSWGQQQAQPGQRDPGSSWTEF